MKPEIMIPWDTLPFSGTLSPPAETEAFEVDPSKAYFSALPTELKIAVLDQFAMDYKLETGRVIFIHDRRLIVSNAEHIETLKAIRRCDRELAALGLRQLFRAVNFTPYKRTRPNWLSLLEQTIFLKIAPHVRYATIYLDDPSLPLMTKILRHLTNVQWLVLDSKLQRKSPQILDALSHFTMLRRLSIFSISSPMTIATVEANTAVLRQSGRTLRTLEFYCNPDFPPPTCLLEAIRDFVTSLSHLYVYSTRNSPIVDFLVRGKWGSQLTIDSMHLEECMEFDAWVIASVVEKFRALDTLRVESCGGPGTYGNGDLEGVKEQADYILRQLEPLKRRPLESLRIVHATDIEYRHMACIPVLRLLVYDPLDQALLAELLRQPKCFPGMNYFELQYLKEPDPETTATFDAIKAAVESRNCTFVDARRLFKPPRHM